MNENNKLIIGFDPAQSGDDKTFTALYKQHSDGSIELIDYTGKALNKEDVLKFAQHYDNVKIGSIKADY